MFFQILGAIAGSGHALLSGRTMDGLAAVRGPRPPGCQQPKLTQRQARIAQQMQDRPRTASAAIPWRRLPPKFGVTRPTISRHLATAPPQ